MNSLLDRTTDLDKQELVIFLKQLKKDMLAYRSKLRLIRIFLDFLLIVFIIGLSYFVIVHENVSVILVVGSVTILVLLPVYTYSYKYNRVDFILNYLEYYITTLNKDKFADDKIEFDINKIVLYLSKQFTINKYRLVKYIHERNTRELINMMKIA